MAAKPAVLLVTGFPFWALGDGQRMRLLALVWVLGRVCRLTILYVGPADERDARRLRELRVNAAFHAIGAVADHGVHRRAVQALCKGQRFDACIIERLGLDHVREALPEGVKAVLDSHDLLAERERSRAARGLPQGGTTLAWELSRFARYDCVLMIQAEEHARVAPHLAATRVIVAPHPVVFPRRPTRPEGRVLGFVGADNEPNLDGLSWFADSVWPLIVDGGERGGGGDGGGGGGVGEPDVGGHPADDGDGGDGASPRAVVHLFGRIGAAWRPAAQGGFVRHGFVADFAQVWGTIDVAINPVRWGSGLKIKSVEALGNGVPLVTTAEGARGLGGAQGFVLADDPAEFADACLRLLADARLRERIGNAGHAWASRHLSPQACFGEFVHWLTNG